MVVNEGVAQSSGNDRIAVTGPNSARQEDTEFFEISWLNYQKMEPQ